MAFGSFHLQNMEIQPYLPPVRPFPSNRYDANKGKSMTAVRPVTIDHGSLHLTEVITIDVDHCPSENEVYQFSCIKPYAERSTEPNGRLNLSVITGMLTQSKTGQGIRYNNILITSDNDTLLRPLGRLVELLHREHIMTERHFSIPRAQSDWKRRRNIRLQRIVISQKERTST